VDRASDCVVLRKNHKTTNVARRIAALIDVEVGGAVVSEDRASRRL